MRNLFQERPSIIHLADLNLFRESKKSLLSTF
jgi:hypothetical protein